MGRKFYLKNNFEVNILQKLHYQNVGTCDRKEEGFEREWLPVPGVQIPDGDQEFADDDPVAQVQHLQAAAVYNLEISDVTQFIVTLTMPWIDLSKSNIISPDDFVRQFYFSRTAHISHEIW